MTPNSVSNRDKKSLCSIKYYSSSGLAHINFAYLVREHISPGNSIRSIWEVEYKGRDVSYLVYNSFHRELYEAMRSVYNSLTEIL